MKKMLCLTLALVLVLSLCSCGGGGNTLFEEAAPSQSVMTFYSFDGESGWRDWISDNDKENEILKELAAVNAKKAEDWTPEQASYPMYGFAIGTADGMGLNMLWTNGYLITRTGEGYEFDYDFGAVIEGIECWGSDSAKEAGIETRNAVSQVSSMPNSYYLALSDGRWNEAYLGRAGELTPDEGISMELVEWTGESVTVRFINDTDLEWCYGEYFHLEVELDGVWYNVPVEPSENWGFNDIAIILEAHDSQEKTYKLSMYGELPEGHYRLAAENMAVETTLAEQN